MVARTPKPEADKDRTPTAVAETTPYQSSVTSAWLAESIMQMQHSIGEMKAGLATLKSASDKQGDKLDRISHIIYAAGAVAAVILAVSGFVLNKGFDLLLAAFKAAH